MEGVSGGVEENRRERKSEKTKSIYASKKGNLGSPLL